MNMEIQTYLENLVNAARIAQQEYETYSQERVDAACRAIGKIVYDNAELLGPMAVDETGMGNYESKIAKRYGRRSAEHAVDDKTSPENAGRNGKNTG